MGVGPNIDPTAIACVIVGGVTTILVTGSPTADTPAQSRAGSDPAGTIDGCGLTESPHFCLLYRKHTFAICSRIQSGRRLWVNRQGHHIGISQPFVQRDPVRATVRAFENAVAICSRIQGGRRNRVNYQGAYSIHRHAVMDRGPIATTVHGFEYTTVIGPRIKGGWRFRVDCQDENPGIRQAVVDRAAVPRRRWCFYIRLFPRSQHREWST